jgi:acyl-coenzyme A thioesterase PaaI-like protein
MTTMKNLKYHPDFNILWCQDLLNSNNIISDSIEIPTQHRLRTADTDNDNNTPLHGEGEDAVSNSMFAQTLYTPSAIRAQINFKRRTSEPDSVNPWEYCSLLSLGSGLDGKTGRAHGGFNALILDQMTGSVASMVSATTAPATATLTVDYKAPIDTPGVVLCRGWAVSRQGRKTWVRATIEDGHGQTGGRTGKVLASGKALFIDPKPITPTPDKSKSKSKL